MSNDICNYFKRVSDHISKVICSTTLRPNHAFQTNRTSVLVPFVAAYNRTCSWWICEKMWGWVWDKDVFETRISGRNKSCKLWAQVKQLLSNIPLLSQFWQNKYTYKINLLSAPSIGLCCVWIQSLVAALSLGPPTWAWLDNTWRWLTLSPIDLQLKILYADGPWSFLCALTAILDE